MLGFVLPYSGLNVFTLQWVGSVVVAYSGVFNFRPLTEVSCFTRQRRLFCVLPSRGRLTLQKRRCVNSTARGVFSCRFLHPIKLLSSSLTRPVSFSSPKLVFPIRVCFAPHGLICPQGVSCASGRCGAPLGVVLRCVAPSARCFPPLRWFPPSELFSPLCPVSRPALTTPCLVSPLPCSPPCHFPLQAGPWSSTPASPSLYPRVGFLPAFAYPLTGPTTRLHI